MVSPAQFRSLCLALEGTLETPHVDRAAFRVARIYATLHPDGRTANLKFEPDAQALQCEMHPHVFAPVPGGWGPMGWTSVQLLEVNVAVLSQALYIAWSGAKPKPKPKAKPKRQRA